MLARIVNWMSGMFFRKLYLKTRLFFYSIRKAVSSFIIFAIIAVLLYSFINSFVFKKIIYKEAESMQAHAKYDSAINLYNTAYFYYRLNHLSEENKELYFGIPYQISLCYLAQKNKPASVETMLKALTAIQTQYGIFSRENSYFIRKYLISYYLENNRVNLAKREFNNLLVIFKNIGYSGNEMSDIIRISGDIYYQQKRYDTAINFYEQAYKSLVAQQEIDYEVFSKIVGRICDYDIINGRQNAAVDMYKSSIQILKTTGKHEDELTAKMLLKLAGLYTSMGNIQMTEAISCYEEAIDIIKKLPKTSYLRQNITQYYITLKGLYNQSNQFHKAEAIDVELARRERFGFLY